MEITEAIKRNAKFILVGTKAVNERNGMSETWHVLVKHCNIEPLDVFELPIRGLFLIAVPVDSQEAVSKIAEITNNNLFTFQFCKTFTPLERVFKSSLENITIAAQDLLGRIPEDARWRVTVNKRHTKIQRSEIIEKIATHPSAPKGKIDLESPQWKVIVEVFGEWTGVSVLPTGMVLQLGK